MTPQDRATVAATVADLPADQIDSIIALHGNLLKRASKRREGLLRDLEAIDRAIDMRTYALQLLADR